MYTKKQAGSVYFEQSRLYGKITWFLYSSLFFILHVFYTIFFFAILKKTLKKIETNTSTLCQETKLPLKFA